MQKSCDIFHSQTEEKTSKTEQNQTSKYRKSLEKVFVQVPRQKMTLCWLSSEIEGVKNRLSPVQQKSKIPVHRVPRLENNRGKSSSSEGEVDMKQRIPRDRVEKSQNKKPSKIPIAIGRASSKDVGGGKIPKSVIAATGKRPLGSDSGRVNV